VLSRDQYCGSITKEKLEGEFHLWNKQDVWLLGERLATAKPVEVRAARSHLSCDWDVWFRRPFEGGTHAEAYDIDYTVERVGEAQIVSLTPFVRPNATAR
jgi:hypothetical protein